MKIGASIQGPQRINLQDFVDSSILNLPTTENQMYPVQIQLFDELLTFLFPEKTKSIPELLGDFASLLLSL